MLYWGMCLSDDIIEEEELDCWNMEGHGYLMAGLTKHSTFRYSRSSSVLNQELPLLRRCVYKEMTSILLPPNATPRKEAN